MDKKIFISSTCYDLIDLRAELKAYLKNAGLVPVMSDQLDSDFITFHDQNSIETCLINLRDSDMVIIVLSQRYGPSLEKAGFEAVSATHLEYQEAVKAGKRIMMFVRDRLEADMATYQKTKEVTSLSWVNEKDIQIFDLVKAHKRLANTEKNNWYWTFKDSVDVKKRLDVELRTNIAEVKLNDLIKSGNIPFVTVDIDPDYTLAHASMKFKIIPENLGSHPAIEPFIIMYAAKNYEEVLAAEEQDYNVENLYDSIPSLRPGEKSRPVVFEFGFNQHRVNSGIHYFIIEAEYKNSLGDYLSDITELEVEVVVGEYKVLQVNKHFAGKRYKGQYSFRKIIG